MLHELHINSISDDQLAIRDAVEAICADFGADYRPSATATGAGRVNSVTPSPAAAGSATMPEEHGGAGLGISAAAMVMRTIGKLGAAAVSSVHLNLFDRSRWSFGTEEQKRRCCRR
jgi:acyl-CoA dehydrogenase